MNKIKSRREDLDISSCYCLTISLLAFFSVMLEDNIRKKMLKRTKRKKENKNVYYHEKKRETLNRTYA